MFRSYCNSIIELKVAQERLQYLQNKKEELFTLYIMPKAMQVDNVGGQNKPKNTDNVMRYVVAVNTPNENGLSINEEIELLQKQVNHLTALLETMTKSLISLKGIECQLFVEIMINGSKPSEAVNKIAEQSYMSVANVWKHYYPQVKKEMEKVKKGGKQ